MSAEDGFKLDGADAYLIARMFHPPTGELGVAFDGYDLRTEPPTTLDDRERYKVWVMLSLSLSKSKTLPSAKLELLRTIVDIVMSGGQQ